MIALNIETLQVMEPKKKRKNNRIYYVPLVIFEIDKIIVLCVIHKPCGPFYQLVIYLFNRLDSFSPNPLGF
jgi:hypothetical protein